MHSAYRLELGSSSATRHTPSLLSQNTDQLTWSWRKRMIREASWEKGEVVVRSHSSLKERAGVKRGFGLRFRGRRVFAGHAELAPWLRLSPRRCRVRASGLAGSRTGRSPAAGGGAGGVLDAGAREPIIVACGERAPAVQGSRVCGCRRPTAGLRPGSLLAAFIPSFVPGCPRGAWGGFAPGRAGSITGAPAPPWGGGQNERRPRARPQARTGHAACPRWRARRTCPSRIP